MCGYEFLQMIDTDSRDLLSCIGDRNMHEEANK